MTHHFKNKAGLIESLIDRLFQVGGAGLLPAQDDRGLKPLLTAVGMYFDKLADDLIAMRAIAIIQAAALSDKMIACSVRPGRATPSLRRGGPY